MGVFFSSVTRHQVMAAILTFAMMMLLTLLYILGQFIPEAGGWMNTLIGSVSYIDLWIASSRGSVVPRLLVLHLTVAVFWLYLATKVLEARKWS